MIIAGKKKEVIPDRHREEEMKRSTTIKIGILPAMLICLLLFSFSGEKYTLLNSIKTTSGRITTDMLGNLYLLNENSVEKYDINGMLLKSYTLKNSGELSQVDARDPYKVLLFFRDFSLLLFLDNMLSPQGKVVDLTSFGFTAPGPVCSSAQGGLWVYNGFNSELVKLDDQYQRTQTVNLATVLNLALKPNFMLEAGGRVYLNNPASGILVFDRYGTYIKTIPLKAIQEFQVREDALFYFADGKLKAYNLKSFEETEFLLPRDSILSARIEKNRLYLRKEGRMEVYSYE